LRSSLEKVVMFFKVFLRKHIVETMLERPDIDKEYLAKNTDERDKPHDIRLRESQS